MLFLGSMTASAQAQLREEIEEKKPSRLEIEQLQREVKEEKETKKAYRLLSNLELSGSYENNPRLAQIRKGDTSGHARYSLVFKRPLGKIFLFSFNYDIDATAYSDINDLSNLLNHTRFSFDRKWNKYFMSGVGYDFSSFYYPYDITSDFLFHKGFLYVKNTLSKKLYHQITLEEGVKDYPHARAYAHSTTTYQNRDRRDYRHNIDYSIGLNLTDKMFIRFKTKFGINDSNAFYQDYNDFNTWDYAPFLTYKWSDKCSTRLSLTVSEKEYKNRTVGSQIDKRQDTTYTGEIGIKYNLTKNSTVDLSYGYSDNHSNDPTTEYASSTINAGWQYQF
jgi:opacity protein-like surface antigen